MKETLVNNHVPISLGHLAPLYAEVAPLDGKVALVCEGGGQRGATAAATQPGAGLEPQSA